MLSPVARIAMCDYRIALLSRDPVGNAAIIKKLIRRKRILENKMMINKKP